MRASALRRPTALLLLLAGCCDAFNVVPPSPLLRPPTTKLLRANDATMMPIGVPKVLEISPRESRAPAVL